MRRSQGPGARSVPARGEHRRRPTTPSLSRGDSLRRGLLLCLSGLHLGRASAHALGVPLPVRLPRRHLAPRLGLRLATKLGLALEERDDLRLEKVLTGAAVHVRSGLELVVHNIGEELHVVPDVYGLLRSTPAAAAAAAVPTQAPAASAIGVAIGPLLLPVALEQPRARRVVSRRDDDDFGVGIARNARAHGLAFDRCRHLGHCSAGPLAGDASDLLGVGTVGVGSATAVLGRRASVREVEPAAVT